MWRVMKVVKIIIVQLAVLAAGLVGIELALAYFLPLPVHGGMYVDAKGGVVQIADTELTLKPNLDVTHISAEFSKRIRTNELGYRRIGDDSRAADVVFLGDSFTFGHGVADEETFASIVCMRSNLACQNLGRSGTDTFDQIAILRHALAARGMRPRTVVVVMLAACWLDNYGNDLSENEAHYLRLRSTPAGAAKPSAFGLRQANAGEVSAPSPAAAPPSASLVKKLQRMLGNFEIVKRVMLIASSGLKRGLYACSPADRLDTAKEATRAALGELELLAAEFGFKLELFTVHPYQELDGAFRITQSLIGSIVPQSIHYVPTASRFSRDDYYPYDGHFNAQGHARMAASIETALAPR
jgi:hypothetical protein